MKSMRRNTRLAVVVLVASLLNPASVMAVPDAGTARFAAVTASTAETTPPAFSQTRAMAHIKKLVANGPRKAGSASERKAGDYVIAQLKSYGYTVKTQKVKIPYGRTTRNIIAELPGTTDRVIVVGGHYDSKVPAPGANDNASGIAVLLEEARILADTTPTATLRFIVFGAEEVCGPSPRNHHYGSRKYVKSLSKAQLKKISGMVAVDMVGYGTVFNVRTMKRGPMTVVKSLQAWGKSHGETIVFLKDRGVDGWSDHEAFEKKGVPVAWLEWRYDSQCHKKGDKYSHIQPKKIGRSGKFLRSWLLSLDEAKVAKLRP